MVIQQLDRALESVSHHDVELAGMVIAGDLRVVAALLHIIRCVERMGDQCANIAKLGRGVAS